MPVVALARCLLFSSTIITACVSFIDRFLKLALAVRLFFLANTCVSTRSSTFLCELLFSSSACQCSLTRSKVRETTQVTAMSRRHLYLYCPHSFLLWGAGYGNQSRPRPISLTFVLASSSRAQVNSLLPITTNLSPV